MTATAKSYETVEAGELEVGDYLRRSVWNNREHRTERIYQAIIRIEDGERARWVYFTATDRIRPTRTTRVQRKRRELTLSEVPERIVA